MISLDLEVDFSCDQVVVCSYISSALGADVGSSRGTGDTDVINGSLFDGLVKSMWSCDSFCVGILFP